MSNKVIKFTSVQQKKLQTKEKEKKMCNLCYDAIWCTLGTRINGNLPKSKKKNKTRTNKYIS